MAWRPQIVRSEGQALVTDEADFMASEHFTVKRVGITIDASTVGADANGNKILPRGCTMGEITDAGASQGKYRAYASGHSDGSEVAKGFLMESVNLRYGDVVCGLMISGSVIAERCSGLDSAAAADLPSFTFQ